MQPNSSILIVDDDPSHLKLYSLIIERGGFRPVTVLANGTALILPDKSIAVAVMDYRLGMLTAVDAVQQIRRMYAEVPVVVLSDMGWMPEDIAPFAAGFVRKGEPQQLLDMVSSLVNGSHQQRA